MPVLPPPQFESLRALAEILIPPGGTLELGAQGAGVATRIATWMERASLPTQRRFRFLVRAWDLGPVFARGFRKPFHRLDPDKQQEWVDATHHSKRLDRRMPITFLKQLVYLAYASSPDVERMIGYDYTCRLDGEPHALLER